MSEYIKTVFLDIGSVLLTNGWDTKSRKLASAKFNLGKDCEDFEARHEDLFAGLKEILMWKLPPILELMLFNT